MKTPSQTVLTAEQIAARKAAEAFFADLLAKPNAQTQRTERAKATAQARAQSTALSNPNPTRSEYFSAEERQYQIITQECTTCGSSTQYALTKVIRYRALRRKDKLFIEIPTLLPSALDIPSRVIREYETTDFCAHCVETAQRIDDVCQRAQSPQLSLFK